MNAEIPFVNNICKWNKTDVTGALFTGSFSIAILYSHFVILLQYNICTYVTFISAFSMSAILPISEGPFPIVFLYVSLFKSFSQWQCWICSFLYFQNIFRSIFCMSLSSIKAKRLFLGKDRFYVLYLLDLWSLDSESSIHHLTVFYSQTNSYFSLTEVNWITFVILKINTRKIYIKRPMHDKFSDMIHVI